ncbi:hypothetical protein [Nostoc sp.]
MVLLNPKTDEKRSLLFLPPLIFPELTQVASYSPLALCIGVLGHYS